MPRQTPGGRRNTLAPMAGLAIAPAKQPRQPVGRISVSVIRRPSAPHDAAAQYARPEEGRAIAPTMRHLS
jgi:hypothetical protein